MYVTCLLLCATVLDGVSLSGHLFVVDFLFLLLFFVLFFCFFRVWGSYAHLACHILNTFVKLIHWHLLVLVSLY